MTNQHVDNSTKNPTPLPKKKVDHGPIGTSTKQIAGYFTVSGIQNETTIFEKDWPLFAFKENPDNAYDWLNDYYPVSDPINIYEYTARRHIGISIQINPISGDPYETRIFTICVRNSNVDEIRITEFERPEQLFSYFQWQSTKRYQHRSTTGVLGDYLKRHGGMAHASWNNNIGDIDEIDRRWPVPIFLRFNGKEYQVYIGYDRYKGPDVEISEQLKSYATKYTEVECSLPVSKINCDGDPNAIHSVDRMSLTEKLCRYYKQYKLAKMNTHFSLDIKYRENNIHITEVDE